MPAATQPMDLTAVELSRAIHARQVSCREVMEACLARVDRLNPTVNALVSLRPRDELLAEALALINQVLDETLAEQEGDFDADSRFAIARP